MTSLPRDARLTDCRRLFLRDYEIWINIGGGRIVPRLTKLL